MTSFSHETLGLVNYTDSPGDDRIRDGHLPDGFEPLEAKGVKILSRAAKSSSQQGPDQHMAMEMAIRIQHSNG